MTQPGSAILVAAASAVTCPPTHAEPIRGTACSDIDLASFLADGFHTAAIPIATDSTLSSDGPGATQPALVTVAALSAQVLALQGLIVSLSWHLQSSSTPNLQQQPQLTAAPPVVVQPTIVNVQQGLWTFSAGTGELPPSHLFKLRASSFPAATARVKGDYGSHHSNALATHRMFPSLLQHNVTFISPVSFVLALRAMECIQFDTAPTVLMAFYSGRVGSRDLSIIHF
ncbi:hypothetical protein P3T76_001197 [Phytophthora citrophthora]|uniref:Uncharacterized protein n=1 Tax=Phytophthora citrophthora TaxID=4793 RepID=A0AAD9GYL8_9STRA|nr:hypothetical protein P3T76_001197 [Phytophthora citrophthora]